MRKPPQPGAHAATRPALRDGSARRRPPRRAAIEATLAPSPTLAFRAEFHDAVANFLTDTDCQDAFERRATWRVLEAMRERDLGGYVASEWHQLDLVAGLAHADHQSSAHHQGIAGVFAAFACWLGLVGLLETGFALARIDELVASMPTDDALLGISASAHRLLGAPAPSARRDSLDARHDGSAPAPPARAN